MSKHTPLPWVKDYGGTVGHIKSVPENLEPRDFTPTVARYDQKALLVSEEEAEANAQLIVTAVNNHAKLVEALRECRDAIMYTPQDMYDLPVRIDKLLAQLDGELE